jgi:hypothetical protein
MNKTASECVAEEDRTSLLNLGRGSAIERFDDELARVVDNILDVNTTDAARTITLTVTFKPAKDRGRCDVGVKIASKLAPAEPFETVIFVGRDGRGPIAVEHNPDQMKMSFMSTAPQLREVV